jgi:hypothetical protein
MIYCFCCDFYEKSKHPKFYDDAIAVMRSANEHCFSTKEDFDVFVYRVERKLELSKPSGHKAYVSVYTSEDRKGQIYIESGKVDGDIARIYFHPVKSVLEYDMETGHFTGSLFSKEGKSIQNAR